VKNWVYQSVRDASTDVPCQEPATEPSDIKSFIRLYDTFRKEMTHIVDFLMKKFGEEFTLFCCTPSNTPLSEEEVQHLLDIMSMRPTENVDQETKTNCEQTIQNVPDETLELPHVVINAGLTIPKGKRLLRRNTTFL
jgi:hypothetical protein